VSTEYAVYLVESTSTKKQVFELSHVTFNFKDKRISIPLYLSVGKRVKGTPCTGTEALYRPYGP